MRMSKEDYVDHEVRIRMLERLGHDLNVKMNTLIGIVITGFAMPLILKLWGVA
jgi:hypothetical protein